MVAGFQNADFSKRSEQFDESDDHLGGGTRLGQSTVIGVCVAPNRASRHRQYVVQVRPDERRSSFIASPESALPGCVATR